MTPLTLSEFTQCLFLAFLCRSAIGEDVEKIRLQRELQSKTGRLEAVQTQCTLLERNLSAVKTQNTRLLEEVEALNQKVKRVCVSQCSLLGVSVSGWVCR